MLLILVVVLGFAQNILKFVEWNRTKKKQENDVEEDQRATMPKDKQIRERGVGCAWTTETIAILFIYFSESILVYHYVP